MLGRNLHLCFSMIKRPLGPESIADGADHDRWSAAATPSPPSVLVKNFNSVYDATTAFDDSATATTSTDSEPDAPAYISAATPDFAAAFASQRFFFSDPGSSNSIVESAAAGTEREPAGEGFRDSVAIPTYSPDPYSDFRRSMEEMVEARGGESDWEYLHELLLCYLALNPKNTHKFIIGAFSDLVVSLMPPLPDPGVRRR